MKKMATIFGLMLMTWNYSYADSTCGNVSVTKDPAVQQGVEVLKIKIAEANIYGDAKTRVAPTAKIVKAKSQEVIDLIQCLVGRGKISLTLDVEALKIKVNEIARLEKMTTEHGGRIVPTQEEIQIVDNAIETMKINRLALAYLANVTAVAPTE